MEEEINKLRKQYGDRCQYEKSDSGAIKLTLSVHVGKEGEEGFSATVAINCAPDYPETAASVQVISTAGVPAEVMSQMATRLGEVASENKGPETLLLLVRIVRRFLMDQRVHECPACKADLTGSQEDSWRSHCGHFYHRACIVSLIQNSARAQQQQEQQENRPEGSAEASSERRPVCPACGQYEFSLREDKPVSRRIAGGGGGGGGGGRNRNRRGRNQGAGGEGETGGEVGEGVGQGDQRRRRPRRPPRSRGGENSAPGTAPGGGEGEGEGAEGEGEAAPGQRRQRKKLSQSQRRRRQQQRSGGGDGDADAEATAAGASGGEGGDDPKLFNRRRQADMRFNQFEQLRNQVGADNGKGGGRRGGGRGGGEFAPQPGYIDEMGGFYAPDGYYYYDGPNGFYAALETYGGGGRGRGGGGGGGGRRRNRPRRPRGEGSNGDGGAGIAAEDQAIQSARVAEA